MMGEIGRRVHVPLVLRDERVLIHYEGDRLVLQRNGRGEPYLTIWHDTDGETERWISLRTTNADVARYLKRRKSLRELFDDAPDPFLYVVDYRDLNRSEPIAMWLATLREFPREELPAPDSRYTPELTPEEDRARDIETVLIDGVWDMPALSKYERGYRQASAFATVVAKRPTGAVVEAGRIESFNFSSGYTYKSAFDVLIRGLRPEQRPKMESVQYSSPGVVVYRVAPEVRDHLRDALRWFRENKRTVARIYPTVHEAQQDLKKRVSRPQDSPEAKAEIAQLKASLRTPMQSLVQALVTVSWDELCRICPDEYQAAEMILAYVRRLRRLARHNDNGTAVIE